MARLVSPPTLNGLRHVNPVSKLSRPAPIQSVSSRTTESAAPAASRTQLLAASSRTFASARRLAPGGIKFVAKPRTDYEQMEGIKFRKTKIPGPITKAVGKANARRHSAILRRLPTEIFHRRAKASTTSTAEVEDIVAEVEEKEYTASFQEAEDVSDWDADCLSEDEDTSIMFGNTSFDDTRDSSMQNNTFNVFERRFVSEKRVTKGRRIASCPRYIGCDIGLPRHRPMPKPKPRHVRENQRHPYYNAPPAPETSKMPYLVWPLVTLAVISSGNTRPVPALSSRNKPKPTEKLLKESRASTKVPFRAVKPASARLKPTAKPTSTKSKAVRAKASKCVKPFKPLKPVLKSALRRSGVVPHAKQLQFLEGPIRPRFYAQGELVKQFTLVAEKNEDLNEWTPLVCPNHRRSSSAGRGTTQLFEGSTSHGLITLKQRFLARYASVQQYEKRQNQEASAASERPGLGQLEYGNAEFKIALQATDAITAQDIGMLQDLSTIGKGTPKGSSKSIAGRVLVFGSFREPFKPAVIPTKMVKPYKKPLRWPATGSEGRLETFANKHLSSLQNADIEY